MDASLRHFVTFWLQEPIKQLYAIVNAHCTPLSVISINKLSGFVAVQAIICSYNISPTEFYEDLDSNKGSYKVPRLCIDRDEYFQILHRMSAEQPLVEGSGCWVPSGTVSVHLTEFQRAISHQCPYIGYIPSIGQVLCIDDDVVQTRAHLKV